MNCPNCKKELPNEAKFCLHCGTKIEVDNTTIECPSCHVRIPKDSKFCPDCGKKVEEKIEGVTMVLPYIYDQYLSFHDGLCCIKKDGLYGYIDRTGKTVIPFIYMYADDFYEGIANVTAFPGKGQSGWIDTSGALAVPKSNVHHASFFRNFSDGLALFCASNNEGKSRYGFVDKKGVIVVPARYKNAQYFHEGLAAVQDPQYLKWGYVDKTGKLKIPFQFSEASNFSEGLASVRIELNGKYGYIDKNGKLVIPCVYNSAGEFSHERAVVQKVKEGEKGCINKYGKEVIPFVYTQIVPFKEGLAAAYTMDKKSGMIDINGNVIIPFKDWHLRSLYEYSSEGLIPFSENGKWGYLDKRGNVAIPCHFEKTYPVYEGYACVKNNGKYGLIKIDLSWQK